jgi:hypothetical protein
MADEPRIARPARSRPLRLYEVVMGGCVVLISVISLFVALSANRTQERMLAASVWPSLISGTSNITLEGDPQISIDLLNRGTGPARVRWAQLLHDGTPVRDIDELLARCCAGDGGAAARDQLQFLSSGIQRRVVGADEWIALLRVPQPQPVHPLWNALDRERHRMELRVCYCSVLDDCWVLDSTEDEPEPVRQCPRTPDVLWNG